jgi:hypothetical protein
MKIKNNQIFYQNFLNNFDDDGIIDIFKEENTTEGIIDFIKDKSM